MEDDNFMEATFKEISIVPDYRALQIIRENRCELEKIVSSGNDIFKDICRRSHQREDFQSFKKQLHDVEEYLKKNEINTVMTSENAQAIAEQLSTLFQLTKEEIIILLNQLPVTESMLEMLFPGKFGKDQVSLVVAFLDQFLPGNEEAAQEEEEEDDEE